MAQLQLTQDPSADALLSEDPFALLVGMLLDQQIPMEVAFAGPKKILDRLQRDGLCQQVAMEIAFVGPRKIFERIGGFESALIADYDPDKFAALCAESPAVHRFPGSMAKRIQELAREIVDQYNGDTAALWTTGDPDGAEVLRRLRALPGFGEQKAKIFLALLGKQYGVTPTGWQSAAGDYGAAGTHMSIADVVDKASLQQVREYKKKMKADLKAAKEKR